MIEREREAGGKGGVRSIQYRDFTRVGGVELKVLRDGEREMMMMMEWNGKGNDKRDGVFRG